jgi:N-acetylmuramoyl-L-alanine amidase
MVSSLIQRWRKLLQASSLVTISVLLTVTLFERVYTKNGQNLASVVPKASPSIMSAASSASNVPNAFEQQIVKLRHFYQVTPKLSIDQLITRETAQLDDIAGMPIASLQPPTQYRIDAHPSNFGDRLVRDAQGKPLQNKLLIVLHETTSAASGAINTALTPHARDEDQISYHAVICQDGTIIYLVDPGKRAYGAGDSAFKGTSGPERVQTNKKLKSSVNNFAYHISLETPADGYNAEAEHSGYSGAQYSSLAWLIAQSGAESDRITTHLAVDQSGERQDPRSFETAWLQQELALQTNDFTSNDFISLDPAKIP